MARHIQITSANVNCSSATASPQRPAALAGNSPYAAKPSCQRYLAPPGTPQVNCRNVVTLQQPPRQANDSGPAARGRLSPPTASPIPVSSCRTGSMTVPIGFGTLASSASAMTLPPDGLMRPSLFSYVPGADVKVRAPERMYSSPLLSWKSLQQRGAAVEEKLAATGASQPGGLPENLHVGGPGEAAEQPFSALCNSMKLGLANLTSELNQASSNVEKEFDTPIKTAPTLKASAAEGVCLNFDVTKFVEDPPTSCTTVSSPVAVSSTPDESALALSEDGAGPTSDKIPSEQNYTAEQWDAFRELEEVEMLRENHNLEHLLAQERSRSAQMQKIFATELMAQKDAHTRDVSALEAMVSKVVAENKKLSGMVEKLCGQVQDGAFDMTAVTDSTTQDTSDASSSESKKSLRTGLAANGAQSRVNAQRNCPVAHRKGSSDAETSTLPSESEDLYLTSGDDTSASSVRMRMLLARERQADLAYTYAD